MFVIVIFTICMHQSRPILFSLWGAMGEGTKGELHFTHRCSEECLWSKSWIEDHLCGQMGISIRWHPLANSPFALWQDCSCGNSLMVSYIHDVVKAFSLCYWHREMLCFLWNRFYSTENIWRTLEKSHLAAEDSNRMMVHNWITLLADSIPKGIANMAACLLAI